MQYVLYNELSNNGKGGETLEVVKGKLSGEFEAVNVVSLDPKEFVSKLTADDIIILCGGDGTLNKFANNTADLEIPCDILLFPAGTGNDFYRDIKENYDDSEMPSIKKFVTNLPVVTIDGKQYRFLNGIGFGVDGVCCEMADDMKAAGKKDINYTSLSIKIVLFKFKCPHAWITVDGETVEYKRAWIASAMNGRYYGGGMKAAPDQDRLGDTLTCMVFKDKGRIGTLMGFPAIFKGEHINNKKLVAVRTGKEITVRFDKPTALQIDGETVRGVTEYTARK